jgi:hypothetical protein
VIAEFGQPIATDTDKDGKKVDTFAFVQGYSKGGKTARAVGHGVADVLTLGLWELVGTPTEAAFDGTKVSYQVTYDEKNKVENVVPLTEKSREEAPKQITEASRKPEASQEYISQPVPTPSGSKTIPEESIPNRALKPKPVVTAAPDKSKTSGISDKKTAQEYWCWGLGVLVKTDEKTTVTEIADQGYSTARTYLKVGDEIIKVGKDNIDSGNASKILTKPMVSETDGLVPVVVRRDGADIQCRIKPNTP